MKKFGESTKKIVSVATAATLSCVMFAGCTNEGKKKEKEDKPAIEVVTDALNGVGSLFDGTANYSYNSTSTITASKAFSDKLGIEDGFKDFVVKTDAKAKGSLASNDFNITYDGKSVATLNVVADAENGITYVRVPELSQSYLSMTEEEMSDYATKYATQYATGTGIDVTTPSVDIENNIDEKALENSKDKMLEIVKQNLSEMDSKDGEKAEGSLGAVAEYSFTTKTYTVTNQQAADLLKDLLEYVKTDEALVNMICSSSALSKEDFATKIDEQIEKVDEETKDTNSETADVLVYYNKDDIQGIKFEDEEESIKLDSIFLSDDEKFGMFLAVEDNDSDVTFDCGFKVKDEIVNGNLSVTTNGIADGEATAKMNVQDLKVVNEDTGLVKGKVEMSADAMEHKFSSVYNSTSEKDTINVTTSVSLDDEEYISVKTEGAISDASDITIPTGTIYNASIESEMDKYLGECDTEGFTSNIMSVLGDEVSAFIKGYNPSGSFDTNLSSSEDIIGGSDFGSKNDEEAYFEKENVDFSAIECQFNDTKFSMPTKFSTIKNFVKNEDNITEVEAGESEYFNDEKYELFIDVNNSTDGKVSVDDADVTRIKFSGNDTSENKFSMNGITVGSSAEDVIKAFALDGCDASKVETIDLWDEDFNLAVIYLQDGKVTQLSISL